MEIEEPLGTYDEAITKTREFLEDKSTPAIFEAAFDFNGVRVRVDVLERLSNIVADIVKGDHPLGLTSEKLRRLSSLPMNWNKQRAALGFI